MTQHSDIQPMTRAERLRAATHPTHEGLDRSIMIARPFESVPNYGRFLRVQAAFHHDVSPIYEMAEVAEIIPGLSSLSRLEAVRADATDLGIELPALQAPAALGLPLPEALGWLYVVEGSNHGAAFLFKAALKLGLSQAHGARHLSEADAGRAAQWRRFKEGLNAPAFTPKEEARVVDGANAAFLRVMDLVRLHMA